MKAKKKTKNSFNNFEQNEYTEQDFKELEDLARTYLIKQGYEIVELNKRFARFCEIDIIAKDKEYQKQLEIKREQDRIRQQEQQNQPCFPL